MIVVGSDADDDGGGGYKDWEMLAMATESKAEA